MKLVYFYESSKKTIRNTAQTLFSISVRPSTRSSSPSVAVADNLVYSRPTSTNLAEEDLVVHFGRGGGGGRSLRGMLSTP